MVFKMKNLFYKRVIVSLILISICLIISLVLNFSNTGVFLKLDGKLPIYCVDTREKKVAITFDVSLGGEDNTKELLSILNKYHVKATFFLLGLWVDNNTDILKEMYKDGDEIANHSYKHPTMTTISEDRIIREIDITDMKILQITGVKPTLFRCPEGSYNDLVIDAVKSTGHYCIQWDVDSIDWKEEGAQIERERVLSKTKPGSIILFHNNARYTPKNLPIILEKLAKEGYSFVTVSNLIYKNNYKIDLQGKQIQR